MDDNEDYSDDKGDNYEYSDNEEDAMDDLFTLGKRRQRTG